MRRTSQLAAFISCCTDSRPAAPNSTRMSLQPPPRSRVLLGGERLGERRNHRRADAVRQPLEPAVSWRRRPCAAAWRRAASCAPRPRRSSTARAGVLARLDRAPFRRHRFGQLQRLVDVADADQILGVRDHRFRDVAPARAVLLDAEEIGRAAACRGCAASASATRGQPDRDPLRRVVARGLDVDGAGARAAQLARAARRRRISRPSTR